MSKWLNAIAQLTIAGAALGAFLLSWSNSGRIEATNENVQVTNKNVQNTHDAVNSRLTELLELTRQAARAAGVASERKRQEDKGTPSPPSSPH